jgi:hypothetical protein
MLFFEALADFGMGLLTLRTYDGVDHVFDMEVVIR